MIINQVLSFISPLGSKFISNPEDLCGLGFPYEHFTSLASVFAHLHKLRELLLKAYKRNNLAN